MKKETKFGIACLVVLVLIVLSETSEIRGKQVHHAIDLEELDASDLDLD